MDNVGIILWDGTTSLEEVTGQHNIMRASGINRICVAAGGNFASSIATILEKNPIGSYPAFLRATHYCESHFAGDINRKGYFVHYADKPITPTMISKMLQVSTICDVQKIDMIVMLRLVDQSSSIKFSVGHSGLIEGMLERSRGHENFGLMYVTRQFIKKMPPQMTKMQELIEWAVKSPEIKVYGLIQSCQKL
jgi:hypothetical protein